MYDVLISYGDFNRNVCTCMTYQFRMGILDARPTTHDSRPTYPRPTAHQPTHPHHLASPNI